MTSLPRNQCFTWWNFKLYGKCNVKKFIIMVIPSDVVCWNKSIRLGICWTLYGHWCFKVSLKSSPVCMIWHIEFKGDSSKIQDCILLYFTQKSAWHCVQHIFQSCKCSKCYFAWRLLIFVATCYKFWHELDFCFYTELACNMIVFKTCCLGENLLFSCHCVHNFISCVTRFAINFVLIRWIILLISRVFVEVYFS